MSLKELSRDPRIQRIINPLDNNAAWQVDLEQFLSGGTQLTRRSAGESAIIAAQRLLIFLGYSTASSGGFLIDGDLGRGTNSDEMWVSRFFWFSNRPTVLTQQTQPRERLCNLDIARPTGTRA